jgi:hypothetical protein
MAAASDEVGQNTELAKIYKAIEVSIAWDARLLYSLYLMLLSVTNMAMCCHTMAMRVFTRRQRGQ